ncbi:MAG: acyltransferase family protein [Myxococcales bacterium]|nr:acyltransferase family protein [Myxococcales bacterium]
MNAAATEVPPPRDDAFLARFLDIWGGALARWHRAEVRGLDDVPPAPALFVGNHNGLFWTADTFIVAQAMMRRHGIERVPYALGHERVVGQRGFRRFFQRLGGVRAHPDAAAALLQSGRDLVVYPGGDLDVMRPSSRRDEVIFEGRRGFARLALRTGVPIVPIASVGAHDVALVLNDLRPLAEALGIRRHMRIATWPLMLSFPLGLTLGPTPFIGYPSRILIEVLPAIEFERTGPEAAADDAYVFACAARVQAALQHAMTRLADERRHRP